MFFSRSLTDFVLDFSRRSGVDRPAGGDEANLGSLHEGIEGGPDRFDDMRARTLVRLVKDPAERAKPGEVIDQLDFPQGAGDVDRPEFDRRPSACIKDSVDAVSIRESDLYGRARITGRDVWK